MINLQIKPACWAYGLSSTSLEHKSMSFAKSPYSAGGRMFEGLKSRLTRRKRLEATAGGEGF